MNNLLRFAGYLGRRTLRAAHYAFGLASFSARALIALPRQNPFDPALRRNLVTQLIFTGVDALPAVGMLGLAVGVSIVYQLIRILRLVNDAEQTVSVLSQLVVLELGSLLTAIVIIGRSGSAIAVDLGNMRLRRELDGLTLLGVDPVELFVVPRVLAAALSQLMLSVYFSLIAMVCGVAVSALLVSSGIWSYLELLPGALGPLDLLIFTAKNLAWGFIIGATACYHGLRVGHSPTELPQQTQQAIVSALLIVFLLDGLLALALA